ncbi:MAG TPA: response regulator [Polyangia bacterium]|nr:response regulator [Polyangia bacterium]
MPPERILIVDDDPWILRMVSTLLEKRGYGIFTAEDGEEGVLKADQARPDLIITDVMMPRMDGWQMVRALRSRPELAFIPVIFLTALGGEEDRIKGFRLGADDYLAKPFRFEELDLRVHNALKKGKQKPQKIEPEPATTGKKTPSGVSFPKQVGIHGNLEQLGVSSLLVIVEMERKSGMLRIERPGATGRIFARDGRVVAARVDGDAAPKEARKGAEAVYHMLTWSAGRFDFAAVDVDMEDEVQSTTTHLLMEGARLIDEGKR